MYNENAKKLFLTYIELQGLKDKFFNYLEILNEKTLNFNDLRCDPENYVTHAFPWSSTEEGGDFWFGVSVDWVTIYKTFKRLRRI